jgi:hypothetical protein
MYDDTIESFGFPAVQRKKITAAFDGGRITSDGGVMLLAAAERRLGIAQRLASLIADPRDPRLITHSVPDILRARMLAIACGYEDADDLDDLRIDPGFKLACGRLPDTGDDLCSQPTMSRWENAPTLREVVRMSYAMIDIYCASYPRPPAAVTLDIDDTVDVVHGHQQLSLFNAHYDERLVRFAAQLHADPRLRYRDVSSGSDAVTARQDALRQRGAQPSAPLGAPHPLPLADHPADHSRRRPLRSSRGDGMVRGQ